MHPPDRPWASRVYNQHPHPHPTQPLFGPLGHQYPTPRPLPVVNAMPKKISNKEAEAKAAHDKAHKQRVFISDFLGQHSLQMGVAYFYRGHYIYVYPGGHPIEIVPFSIKKGINFTGCVRDAAPVFYPNASGLIPEPTVAAFYQSKVSLYRDRVDQDESIAREYEEAVEDDDMEMPFIARHGPGAAYSGAQVNTMGMTPLVPSQVSSRNASRGNSYVSLPTLAVHGAGKSRKGKAIAPSFHGGNDGDRVQAAYENAMGHSLRSTGGVPPARARPPLHRFMSSPNDLASNVSADTRALPRFVSDPSILDTGSHPATRWGSHALLAGLAVQQAFDGSSSSKAGPSFSRGHSPLATPALSRSASRVPSRSGLANEFNMAEYEAESESESDYHSASRVPSRSGLANEFNMAEYKAESDSDYATLEDDSDSYYGGACFEAGPGPVVSSSSRNRSRTVTPALSKSTFSVGSNSNNALASITYNDGQAYYNEPSSGPLIFSRAASPAVSRSASRVGLNAAYAERQSSSSAKLLGSSLAEASQPSLISLSRSHDTSTTDRIGPAYASQTNLRSAYTFGTTLLSNSSEHPFDFAIGNSFTPHDRAMYLADSAPGSRLPSRPESPEPSFGTQAKGAFASTSHLQHAATAAAAQSSSTYLSDNWADPRATQPPNFNPMASPPSSRNKPIGTGRPRRASQLLNEAHNATHPSTYRSLGSQAVVSARVPKCRIYKHGKGCDGMGTSGTWKTQEARQKGGFAEMYPMLVGEGVTRREMVDWEGLVEEGRGW